ncbi:MAG: 16S rRNA (uracil(1498)-N(3))-methyltransferase [Actinomycetota bacterium]
MSRPVFFADDLGNAAIGEVLVLDGPEGHHAAQVVRLREGEHLDVVDGAGRRIHATVRDVRRDRVDVSIDQIVDEPVPEPRVVVIQALAKGDRGERAVETMTEIGVDVVVPWAAAHAVSQWRGDKAQRGVDKWRTTARSAAKQARRSRLPDVRPLAETGQLRDIVQGASLALLLDEGASAPLSTVSIPDRGDVVIIVGPEGGMSAAEHDTVTSWGARPVHLGPNILRTSTAGSVAAAIVLSATARWR